MRIAIGSDRRGYEYKERIKSLLEREGYKMEDVGPYSDKLPVDYPIYGEKVGKEVAEGRCDKGIVICATGIGIMIACNKVKGIRCGMGYSNAVAALMREHNDANVIAFGQDHMSWEEVAERVQIFLNTEYLGGYHDMRLDQLSKIENGKPIEQSAFIDKEYSC